VALPAAGKGLTAAGHIGLVVNTTATFEVDTEGPMDITAVEISEASGFEGRVREYKVEGQVDSDWKLLSQGTTIGARKIDRFPKVTVWKVRLTVQRMDDYLAIKKFGLYLSL
jgi:alpha-L-fucosidase